MYSIVIPYLSSSKYIDQCKHYLQMNSLLDYELVEIVDETDVYYAYNKGVFQSKYDKVILLNDDMIVSYGWDVPFVETIANEVVVTCNVAEPNPGISHRPDGSVVSTMKLDCGESPDTFDYDKFKQFISENSSDPKVMMNTKGWYMPLGVYKRSFITYPNLLKFPHKANDIFLIDDILPFMGYSFAKVNSFVYHYQSKSWKD